MAGSLVQCSHALAQLKRDRVLLRVAIDLLDSCSPPETDVEIMSDAQYLLELLQRELDCSLEMLGDAIAQRGFYE